MVSFDHRDAGTAEHDWRASERWSEVPRIPVPTAEHAVVIAAHPDDETLGAGALLAQLHAAATPITVVLATHGEAAHDRDLSLLRIHEFNLAVNRLAPRARIVDLGLPDARLRDHRPALTERIADLTDECDLLVAPWSGDGHGDHRVLGEVARGTGIRLLEYPIWLWHWAEPAAAEVPWSEFVAIDAGPGARAKASALAAYDSQRLPVDGAPPIVHDGMAAHFERDWETFVEVAR